MSTPQLGALIGIPYLSNGRNAAIGLDCWGLIRYASERLYGRTVPDYRGYIDARDGKQTAILFANKYAWLHIPKGDEEPGDVVLLTLAGYPIHAGLVVDDHLMLHSLTGRNSCIERYDSGVWAKRWEGVYRWET